LLFFTSQSMVMAAAYSTRYFSEQNIQLTQLTDKKTLRTISPLIID